MIFALFMTDFFDTIGTAVAVGRSGGLTDERGEMEGTGQLLVVDSAAASSGRDRHPVGVRRELALDEAADRRAQLLVLGGGAGGATPGRLSCSQVTRAPVAPDVAVLGADAEVDDVLVGVGC